jgi:hypothetical protein
MRPTLLALLTVLILGFGCGEDLDPGPESLHQGECQEDDASCCFPAVGTGIDSMPAVSACTQWMLDSCDV